MHVITSMRSDVAYSFRVVSRYQSDLNENHWKDIKTIFKYLRNTKDQQLIYGDIDLKLMGYADFNFQSDHDHSKSISGYVFTMNGGVIYQKSFKQYTVANSVCETKYVAASDAAKETIWLKKFITKLRVIFSIDGLILLYCDSTRAIAQAKESKSHHRTKHIL